MNFIEVLKLYDWEEITHSIYKKGRADVLKALNSNKPDLEDFKALISPAAEECIEKLAQSSHYKTSKRFGKTIQLYIPLYLSNECTNQCVYCGFNTCNTIDRKTLTPEEIVTEAKAIKNLGYEHLLLVTGESPRKVDIDYFLKAIRLLKPHFSLISMEVQPLKAEEYKALIKEGLHSVYIYQETYNQSNYRTYHPKGKKSDFEYRLNTPGRLGEAGIYKTGIGCLLGLEDWRTDSFFTALHLKYLQKQYWRGKYSISFPRLRPHVGNYQPQHPITDKQLVQLISAYRILDEDVELSMSVRESRKFRDNIVKLGITSISAGSSTRPGGYADKSDSLEQFEVHDNRTPAEVAKMIQSQGYEAVWKDWDLYLQNKS
ncbi:MAG: 2-iminoacetate synthase ThiH [Bacteroidales bacterium]|nr:2-iminoacetate synthase ThiH [Bacteroidales bacterium]